MENLQSLLKKIEESLVENFEENLKAYRGCDGKYFKSDIIVAFVETFADLRVVVPEKEDDDTSEKEAQTDITEEYSEAWIDKEIQKFPISDSNDETEDADDEAEDTVNDTPSPDSPEKSDRIIHHFTGKCEFLSNAYQAPVTIDGLTYCCNEAAYQAQKTNVDVVRKHFLNMDASEAKRIGHRPHLPEDWETSKVEIMKKICREKFQQNPNLCQMLLNTGDIKLCPEYAEDQFWGVCNGNGGNHLGKILMDIRSEFAEREKEKNNDDYLEKLGCLYSL